MRHQDFEAELTRHIIELREKLARVEVEVAHLADGQAVHTGSQALTAQRLAHIAQSCRDAHILIGLVQLDVKHLRQRGRSNLIREWLPLLTPAALGLLALALVLAGKSDLARQVISLKP